MAQVMIGLDPHKRSHTAVAVDDKEVEIGRLVAAQHRDRATDLFEPRSRRRVHETRAYEQLFVSANGTATAGPWLGE